MDVDDTTRAGLLRGAVAEKRGEHEARVAAWVQASLARLGEAMALLDQLVAAGAVLERERQELVELEARCERAVGVSRG